MKTTYQTIEDKDGNPVEMSANQKQFVRDAEKKGYEVEYDYSGRGMCGRTCPAVDLDRGDRRFSTKANVREDSMGMGSVVYAQN